MESTEVNPQVARKDQVYKPMASVKPETLNYLKGFRRPNFAYVLFEKKQFHLKEGGAIVEGTGLMTLNVENRPEQMQKIEYYTGAVKKFKIIDYGNFPKLNDPNPQRARLAKMHSGPDGSNPWDRLEQNLLHYMTESTKISQLESEKAGLEAKLAAALSKQSQEKAKNGTKD